MSFPSRERFFRRILGLPAEAPDPVGFDFVPAPSGNYSTMESVPPDQLARQVEAWHAEDRRADIAEFLARAPIHAEHAWDKMIGKIYHARAKRALKDARILTYTSHYIHPLESCDEIEGYFDFGNFSYSFSIVSDRFAKLISSEEWDRGEIATTHHLTFGGDETVLVPSYPLTEDAVREVIMRWYEDKFEFARGHWSRVEGKLPELNINIHYQPEEILYADPFADNPTEPEENNL